MTTALMPPPRQRFYDNNGALAAGCLLYTYAAGTVNLKAAYTDSAGLVPHTNPIVLDAKGEALIYWDGAYKVDLKTAAGVQITGYPVDNFTVISSTAAADTLRTDLIAPTGAALVKTAAGTTVEARLALTLTAASLTGGSLTTVAVGTPTPGVTARFNVTSPVSTHADYGFLYNSTVTYVGVGFYGHASFDDNVTFAGGEASDHHHSFQAYPHYGGTGTMGRLSCFWALPDITAGTVTEVSIFKAGNPSGAGTIGSLYGVYIEAMTRGTANYAIYSAGTAASYLGGPLKLGQIAEPAIIQYESNSGNLELTPRVTYDIHLKSRIVRFGSALVEAAYIDNNADGNLYFAPRTGYRIRIATESLDIVTPGAGIRLTNAAGTITKIARLNAAGTAIELI